MITNKNMLSQNLRRTKIFDHTPARFADKDVSREMAKSFRDLIKLGGGFWSWPEVVGKKGDSEVFVPLAEWKKVLKKRT